MTVLQKMLTEDGVPILSYRIELPDFEGSESCAAGFFRALAERAVKYLETDAAEILRAAYRASTDPRRRFTFRPAVYRLSAVRQGQDRLIRTVTLSRGGKTLFRRQAVDVIVGGRVLPCFFENSKKRGKNYCIEDETVI